MATITNVIPVLTITADQIGPLGITLSDAQPDPGGSREPSDLAFIPLLDLPHLDERQGCGLAHAYLDARDYAEGLPQPGAADLPAFTACHSYRAGMCDGNGWRDACLFMEPADSSGWARARRWRLLPDGAGICRADSYGEMVADLRAWPAAKPWADLVARSFGITADARGEVLDDRLITTTADELSLALAWCLVGCDESEIPEIIAVWAPQADLSDPLAALTLPASSIYGALSQAAIHGVRMGETEDLLQEVAL